MEPTGVLGDAMRRFTEMLVDADPASPVPACPDWQVRDLAVHLGTVHRWAAGIVLSGQRIKHPAVMVTEPLAEWYAGCATALLGALAAVDPEEPTPNFARMDERAAFWARRQAHETTVHAVDLAQACGLDLPVDPQVAADGVDEVLRVFSVRMAGRGTPPTVVAPVSVRTTDIARAWTLTPAPEAGPPVVTDDDPAGAVVAGAAADLYLALWRRIPHDRLTVSGSAAEAFLAGPLTS